MTPAVSVLERLGRNADVELHQLVGTYYANPLGFVRDLFPWGKPGPLVAYAEPDVWQCEFLEWLGHEIAVRHFDGVDAVLPIRGAVSSGHGIGKGALAGMVNAFLQSTRRNAKGVVTANTNTQLQDKTWPALIAWMKLCKTANWFETNTSIMYRIGCRETWRVSPQSCAPDNSESFAGQHNVGSTSYYINDEDSNIPNVIHEVEEGGLTDGEPMQFLFGNPTRRSGAFYDIVFGGAGKRWKTWIIDARTCRFPNKALIAQQLEDWGGEDSDRFRVRVRGLPPSASDLQFIDSQRVYDAQKRHVVPLGDEPLLCGLDVARGGVDFNVFRFRRGPDARTIPAIRIPGEESRDSMRLVSKAAQVLDTTYDGRQVEMLFIDGTGIGGPIADRLKQLGYEKRIMEIQFGAASPDPKYANMRAFMWGKGRDWLTHGAIDTSPILEHDMTTPGYDHDKHDRLLLESKEQIKARGEASPDEGDALFLTHAAPVVAKLKQKHQQQRRGRFVGRGTQGTGSGLGWMA